SAALKLLHPFERKRTLVELIDEKVGELGVVPSVLRGGRDLAVRRAGIELEFIAFEITDDDRVTAGIKGNSGKPVESSAVPSHGLEELSVGIVLGQYGVGALLGFDDSLAGRGWIEIRLA